MDFNFIFFMVIIFIMSIPIIGQVDTWDSVKTINHVYLDDEEKLEGIDEHKEYNKLIAYSTLGMVASILLAMLLL